MTTSGLWSNAAAPIPAGRGQADERQRLIAKKASGVAISSRCGCAVRIMLPPTLTYLTDIWFGAGIVRELREILGRFNIQRPLLVTDRGVAASGILARVNLS